ncbi:MAG: hypothetical protein ABIP08_11405 [Lautropia sp.]
MKDRNPLRYGEHHRHVVLGEQQRRLRSAAMRSSRAIVSRVSRADMWDVVSASLKHLGLEYIDLYQIQDFDLLAPIEALRARDGLVRQPKYAHEKVSVSFARGAALPSPAEAGSSPGAESPQRLVGQRRHPSSTALCHQGRRSRSSVRCFGSGTESGE